MPYDVNSLSFESALDGTVPSNSLSHLPPNEASKIAYFSVLFTLYQDFHLYLIFSKAYRMAIIRVWICLLFLFLLFTVLGIGYFPNPIMQYVLGVSLHKNNTVQVIYFWGCIRLQ